MWILDITSIQFWYDILYQSTKLIADCENSDCLGLSYGSFSVALTLDARMACSHTINAINHFAYFLSAFDRH